MKTIKKITALVAVLVLTFSLVACGKASVVGTWKAEQDGTVATYEFKKDGTGSVSISGIVVPSTDPESVSTFYSRSKFSYIFYRSSFDKLASIVFDLTLIE